MTSVVILVPGIMGSVLQLGEEIIWPGPLTSMLLPYNKMQELMREDLVATDVIRRFSITTQYQSLIDDLGILGFDEANHTLVIAAYDWRKDNAQSAKQLATHIDDAVHRHGADVEITLVAHSMGGLVSRYYLESQQFNDRPGFKKIRRLITLATPHGGAALALPLVLGYEKRLFLNKDQVLQLASDPDYPAAYQLLPAKGEPFAWDGDAGGDLLDIYDSGIAKKLGLKDASLGSAQRFRSGLDVSRRPADVRYFSFAGSQQATATQALIRPAAASRLKPFAMEDESGGDGTVPIWSGYLPGLQRQFVGGAHSTIYQNNALRTTLGTLLGKPRTLAGIPDQVQVALRDRVVEPNDVVHLSIGFGTSIRDFSGVLTVERAITNTEGEAIGFAPPQASYPVKYEGVGVEAISLTFEAPGFPGFYRVGIRNDAAGPLSGSDELIVQQA